MKRHRVATHGDIVVGAVLRMVYAHEGGESAAWSECVVTHIDGHTVGLMRPYVQHHGRRAWSVVAEYFDVDVSRLVGQDSWHVVINERGNAESFARYGGDP